MIKTLSLLSLLALLASCSGDKSLFHDYKFGKRYDQGGYYKLGQPYEINGKTYEPKIQPNYNETGKASWYGDKFHGKKTANGDIFDKKALTAAHKTLPLPSMVRVTNIDNGRSLVLMVNDRGPFAKDRIIDVSERASQILEFRNSGTANVRVEFLKEQTDRLLANMNNANNPKIAQNEQIIPETKQDASSKLLESSEKGQVNHFVKAATFAQKDNAQKASEDLSKIGNVNIVEVQRSDKTLYQVKLGPIYNFSSATSLLNQVSSAGYTDAIITQ